RHTRSDRDWSSDVCSSDLREITPISVSTACYDGGCECPCVHPAFIARASVALRERQSPDWPGSAAPIDRRNLSDDAALRSRETEIGRASCRERVWVAGGGG